MRFHKTNIRTAVNADKVKVGTCGYFADTLAGLERYVRQENKLRFGRVIKIENAHRICRFVIDSDISGEQSWTLFYPVKR